MADFREAQQGGYEVISEAAMAAISASTAVFSAAPAKTSKVAFCIRGTGGITYREDGSAATAGANGTDLALGTYEFVLTDEDAKKWRVIQNGGTVTGWIRYYKLKGR